MQTSDRIIAPVFLLGASRSGTTLLRLMLNEHSAIAIPAESHFLISVLDRIRTEGVLRVEDIRCVADLITSHERFQDWTIGESELRAVLENAGECTLAEVIDMTFRLQIRETGKAIWGDKTPEYTPHIDALASVFPAAKFVHIIRDGRDVSLSLRKVGWHGPTEFDRARYWSKTVSRAEAVGKQLGKQRYLRVMYRDLVLDVDKTLKTICDFLEIGFEARMLDFYQHAEKHIASREKRTHKKLRRAPRVQDVDRWKREMSGARAWAFESIAGTTMRDLDLEMSSDSKHLLRSLGYALFYRSVGWAGSRLALLYRMLPMNFRNRLRQSKWAGLVRRPLEMI